LSRQKSRCTAVLTNCSKTLRGSNTSRAAQPVAPERAEPHGIGVKQDILRVEAQVELASNWSPDQLAAFR
jgi:hypothetical protein